MTTELAVELVAMGLAAYAVWLTVPRPPALAWERLWKVGLSVLTAGEVVAGSAAPTEAERQAWRDRVREALPYNPLGRDAEARLRAPRVEEVPIPALEGERALVEELARLPDPPARYQRLFVDEPPAEDELLGDPHALGPGHDPAHLLGPGAGWDEVARWDPALQAVLVRRTQDLVWAVDGLDAERVEALGATLAGARVLVLPPAGEDPIAAEAADALREAVQGALSQASDRVAFVVGGAAVRRLLVALAEDPVLRDRTAAVVALGGAIRGLGPEDATWQAWLDAHFDHNHMDTELRRSIPFFSLVDVDPADPVARSWAAQRFPEPPPTSQGHAPILVVDLGPLVLARLPARVLARGLVLLLALVRSSLG